MDDVPGNVSAVERLRGRLSDRWPALSARLALTRGGRVGRWLILVALVFLTLLGCGQVALWVNAPTVFADTRSQLQADYQPWPFNVIRPVDPAIIEEIQKDEGSAGNGDLIIETKAFWLTPTPPPGEPSPTSTTNATALASAATPTPLIVSSETPGLTPPPPATTTTPTKSLTTSATVIPTLTGTLAPTITITRTGTSGATATRTITPTRTPTRTNTPAASLTPTRTSTVAPTSPPTWTSAPAPSSTPPPTSTPTHTPTASDTPTHTPTVTGTPTATHTPTQTPTASMTPTASNTPSNTLTPSDTPTVTYTPSITPTPTDTPPPTLTPTATATATETNTPTITPIPCSGSIPPGEPDIIPPALSPDGQVASVACGTGVIVDLGSSPIVITGTMDPDYDLVYYERDTGGNIMLDWVIVDVCADSSCSTAYTAFYWGNATADFNTNIGALGYGPPESDNQVIPSTDLWGSTGIAIDVDAVAPAGAYQWIRIQTPLGGSNDPAEVDALEVLP